MKVDRCVQHGSRDWPAWGGKTMTKRHTDKEKLGLGGLGSLMEKSQSLSPRSFSICAIYRWAEQQGYANSWIKKAGLMGYRWVKEACLANLSRSSPWWSLGHKHLEGGSYGGHSLHMLSAAAHRPEGGFAMPLSLTQAKIGHFHGAEALGVLARPCLCQ